MSVWMCWILIVECMMEIEIVYGMERVIITVPVHVKRIQHTKTVYKIIEKPVRAEPGWQLGPFQSVQVAVGDGTKTNAGRGIGGGGDGGDGGIGEHDGGGGGGGGGHGIMDAMMHELDGNITDTHEMLEGHEGGGGGSGGGGDREAMTGLENRPTAAGASGGHRGPPHRFGGFPRPADGGDDEAVAFVLRGRHNAGDRGHRPRIVVRPRGRRPVAIRGTGRAMGGRYDGPYPSGPTVGQQDPFPASVHECNEHAYRGYPDKFGGRPVNGDSGGGGGDGQYQVKETDADFDDPISTASPSLTAILSAAAAAASSVNRIRSRPVHASSAAVYDDGDHVQMMSTSARPPVIVKNLYYTLDPVVPYKDLNQTSSASSPQPPPSKTNK